MEIFKSFIIFPVDYKSKIAFLSLNNEDSSWTYDVDWSFPINKANPVLFIASEEASKECNNEENNDNKNEEKSIHQLAVSESESLLAFTTSDKTLYVLKIGDSSVTVLSRRVFSRTSSCIKFKGNTLFLADKTGDVFEYPCDNENINSPGKWIFGHISQILDLNIAPNSKYILTSDRDEKIRVTNYPATHDIESFCLGHKEFVSSLALISDEVLFSSSGDKTICAWSFPKGKQISVLSLQQTPIQIKALPQFDLTGYLSVCTAENNLEVFKYENIDTSAFKFNKIGEKRYSSEVDVLTCNDFFVKYISEENQICIDRVHVNNDVAIFTTVYGETLKILKLPADFPVKMYRSFDLPLLYKKTYDNVKQYIDRKKARIEERKK